MHILTFKNKNFIQNDIYLMFFKIAIIQYANNV